MTIDDDPTDIVPFSPKPIKRKRGNPSKFIEETRQHILEALNMGAPKKFAAMAGNITYVCLRQWIVRGEAEEFRREEGLPLYDDDGNPVPEDIEVPVGEKTPYEIEDEFYRFLLRYRIADINNSLTYLGVLDDAANIDPKWADKMLKYKHHEIFRDPDKGMLVEVNTSSQIEVTHKHTVDEVDFDRLAAIIKILNETGAIVEGKLAGNSGTDDSPVDAIYTDVPDS